MGKVIGIDLGTTNSCVAVMSGGDPLSSPMQKAPARRHRSSPSPTRVNALSARSRSAKPLRIRRTRFSP